MSKGCILEEDCALPLKLQKTLIGFFKKFYALY